MAKSAKMKKMVGMSPKEGYEHIKKTMGTKSANEFIKAAYRSDQELSKRSLKGNKYLPVHPIHRG